MAMRKVGDRLRAKVDIAAGVSAGDVVRVTSVNQDADAYPHRIYNETQGLDVDDRFFLSDTYWDLLPPEPEQSGSDGFYAVWSSDADAPDARFSSEEEAQAAAEEEARRWPGCEFHVMRSVGVAASGPVVYRKRGL